GGSHCGNRRMLLVLRVALLHAASRQQLIRHRHELLWAHDLSTVCRRHAKGLPINIISPISEYPAEHFASLRKCTRNNYGKGVFTLGLEPVLWQRHHAHD